MKKLIVIFIVIAGALFSCSNNETAQRFYLGTYTDGNSKGIYQYELRSDGQIVALGLKAPSINPSFLSFDASGRYLIAVNEVEDGLVESYRIKPDSLELINHAATGGAHPCHVSLNENNKIVVSNYTGGNVGWLRIGVDGELSELLHVSQHDGQGIAEQQKSPHAHSAWFIGDDVIAVDLGTDELWIYTNRELKQKVKLRSGAGPRHLTKHPDKDVLYVVNELNNSVTRVTKNNDIWVVKESVSTLPNGYVDDSFCADIHISDDGKYLYASNRGHNSIAIFKVRTDTQLLPLAYESVNGDHPRNFALSPDGKFLLVANKNTNNIVSFRRDKESGLLEFVAEMAAPSPVCILFE